MKAPQTIELGDEVQDIITGFRGIAYGYTKWLTGCDTIMVKPTKLSKDGTVAESANIDITLLTVVKKGRVKPPSTPVTEETPKPPGGPRERIPEPHR